MSPSMPLQFCDPVPGLIVTAAIVCRHAIKIGEGSWIMGPVISEEHIEIGTRTTIGKPDHPTTVSARSIRIASGSVVCGQMMCEEGGRTT